MLRELIELWPGGPSVTLGGYFVGFKYIFVLLVLAWAVSLLRWPRRTWLVAGTLVLAASSLLVLQNPLGRAYGVVEGSRGIAELGEIMVVAARGTASDGRMVGEPHPSPFWGYFAATLSGFRGERVLSLYPWLPLFSLLGLGIAVAWSVGRLRESEELPVGALPAVTTFVVLFLSSHRLSFLRDEGPFWTEYFWLTPGVGIAFAALCVCWRLLGASSWIGAAIAFGLVAGLEPRLAVCFGLSVVAWMVASRKNLWREVAVLAVGAIVLVAFGDFRSVTLPAEFGTWHDGINRVLSVTIDAGLVFLLAALGVGWLLRSERKAELVLAWSASTALLLWIVVSFLPRAAALLDPRIVSGYVRLMMALCASYGLYRALAAWVSAFPKIPSEWGFVPRQLRKLESARLALMGLVVLSLPWCFPYWWEPVRMDPLYVESFPAVSRRFIAMGEMLRDTTDADAVLAAGPSYAPWIPALSGRRVLLVGESPERERALETMVQSRDPDQIAVAVTEWNVTHVAWGRLDQPEGTTPVDFVFFEQSPRFEERYRDRRWIRVFEYTP